jgi:hypothetical protein
VAAAPRCSAERAAARAAAAAAGGGAGRDLVCDELGGGLQGVEEKEQVRLIWRRVRQERGHGPGHGRLLHIDLLRGGCCTRGTEPGCNGAAGGGAGAPAPAGEVQRASGW